MVTSGPLIKIDGGRYFACKVQEDGDCQQWARAKAVVAEDGKSWRMDDGMLVNWETSSSGIISSDNGTRLPFHLDLHGSRSPIKAVEAQVGTWALSGEVVVHHGVLVPGLWSGSKVFVNCDISRPAQYFRALEPDPDAGLLVLESNGLVLLASHARRCDIPVGNSYDVATEVVVKID